jgi:hypothetical protein
MTDKLYPFCKSTIISHILKVVTNQSPSFKFIITHSFCTIQRNKVWNTWELQKYHFRFQGLTHPLDACSPLPNNIKIQMTEVRTSPKLTLPIVSIEKLKTLLVLGNIIWTFYKSLRTAQERNTFDRCCFDTVVTDPYNVQLCHINSSSAFWC